MSRNAVLHYSGGHDLQIIQHFLGLGPKIGSSFVRFDENDRIMVIEGPIKGLEGSAHTMDLSFEDISKKRLKFFSEKVSFLVTFAQY